MVSTDISWLQADHDWPGLTAVAGRPGPRRSLDKTTRRQAYNHLLSTAMDTGTVRRGRPFSIGAIENRLHWCHGHDLP